MVKKRTDPFDIVIKGIDISYLLATELSIHFVNTNPINKRFESSRIVRN